MMQSMFMKNDHSEHFLPTNLCLFKVSNSITMLNNAKTDLNKRVCEGRAVYSKCSLYSAILILATS